MSFSASVNFSTIVAPLVAKVYLEFFLRFHRQHHLQAGALRHGHPPSAPTPRPYWPCLRDLHGEIHRLFYQRPAPCHTTALLVMHSSFSTGTFVHAAPSIISHLREKRRENGRQTCPFLASPRAGNAGSPGVSKVITELCIIFVRGKCDLLFWCLPLQQNYHKYILR